MCDTLVALGESTADGVTIFAKNSDREPNEAHQLQLLPKRDYPPGSRVRMTYIDIPQVEHTYAVLLAKPFNIWGAEMGANEHGVAIGNEAVFTRVPYEKGAAMTGMDLLRLGLERGRSALEALLTMTALLEEHGQGGNCGFRHPFYYHNSYILADPGDAWVLETAGRHWAAKQVRATYTISNGITIGGEWDLASADLVRYAVERGWCKGRDDFDFARCYSDPLYTRFSACHYRNQRTSDLLTSQRGRITPRSAMAALRDHGDNDRNWRPDRGLSGIEVCMHVGFGPIRVNQTTGSMASHLARDVQTHFLTATAAPCTSLFKPVWLDAGLPDLGASPSGSYDPETLFWQHERLHRRILQDFSPRIAVCSDERNALEDEWTSRAFKLASASAAERLAFSQYTFRDASRFEAGWLERVRTIPIRRSYSALYRRAWSTFNREAKITEEIDD